MFLSTPENDSGSQEIQQSDILGVRISVNRSVKWSSSVDFSLACSVASRSYSLASWSWFWLIVISSWAAVYALFKDESSA